MNHSLSDRALESLLMFGLSPARASSTHRRLDARARRAAGRLDAALAPSRVALITGPSGAGKSTILRALQDRLSASSRPIVRPPECIPDSGALVDLFRGSVHEAMGLLARAGLADAMVFALRPRDLSAGQRERLRIALALGECAAAPGATLIVDDLGCLLDRPTAQGVARTLARVVAASACRLVCATPHEDLRESLSPSVLVTHDASGRIDVVCKDRP